MFFLVAKCDVKGALTWNDSWSFGQPEETVLGSCIWSVHRQFPALYHSGCIHWSW